MRISALVLLSFVTASSLWAETQVTPESKSKAISIEGFVRREPVLPLSLPDFELTTLDISKEIVFHAGNQTYVGKVPIFVYVPVNRSSRANAVERLVEARLVLIKAAAAKEVSTADLAALRDLIERALVDLRTTSELPKPEDRNKSASVTASPQSAQQSTAGELTPAAATEAKASREP